MEHVIEFNDLKVGQRVKVKGKLCDDGVFMAQKISLKEPDDHVEIMSLIQRIDHQKNTLSLLNREFVLPDGVTIIDSKRNSLSLKELQVGTVVEIKGKYCASEGFGLEKIKIQETMDFDLVKLQGEINGIDREKNALHLAGFTVVVNEKIRISQSQDVSYSNSADPVERNQSENFTIQTISKQDLDRLVFGQQHLGTQHFFLDKYGNYHTVPLSRFPHYIFLRDCLEKPFSDHLYNEYLESSWDYLYGQEKNTRERRGDKIKSYLELYELIASRKYLNENAIENPIIVCPRPDGRLILVDGNHRASIALKLDLDIKAIFVDPDNHLMEVAKVPNEFYGSKRLKMPYQSIFDGEKELVRGRRPDILERIKMVEASDLQGKSVLDLGCNIGASCFLAASFGASRAIGADYSPKLISAAVRLNSYFAAPCSFMVHDLNYELSAVDACDTVFCFSVIDHLGTKTGLVQTIRKKTTRVLYFEGHANSTASDYAYLLNREHFSSIELRGYLRDGVHTNESTRPFFRCEVAG